MAKDLRETNCYDYEDKKHSIITVNNGKLTRYEFDNKTKQYAFSKRQIDGCLIKDETACDWLLYLKKDAKEGKDFNHLIFVELKDSDLIKAIEQIEKTIHKLNISKDNFTIHARAVLTKTYWPDIRDNRILKFRRKIEIESCGTFDCGSQTLIEKKID